MRKIEEIKTFHDGFQIRLNEDGYEYEEFVKSDRIKNGSILIFADKYTDEDADNWFLMDLNMWLNGYGSVL